MRLMQYDYFREIILNQITGTFTELFGKYFINECKSASVLLNLCPEMLGKLYSLGENC